MYERILRLYVKDKLSKMGVKNAVKRGLITAEEAEKIFASKTATTTTE